jgi:hypothetical protein
MNGNYLSLFHVKTSKHFFPNDLVKRWESILKEIIEGYNYVEPELDHDLFIRDVIEKLITDNELDKYSEHQIFKTQIFSVDEKIKELVFPNPKHEGKENINWWQIIILKKGGPVYAEDIKTLYNIDIKIV